MKLLLVLLCLIMPAISYGYVSGIDDTQSNLSQQDQEKLDKAFLTYYQQPSVEKINSLLDLMSNTELLRHKTAWSPLVGFFTVVFAANKNHVFDWMSRNDYNTHAQDVFITALLHAKLTESASVFAQAHGWDAQQMQKLHSYKDTIDLKKLDIILPSHIDTLWGAFFASGDKVYVEKIINVLFMTALPHSDTVPIPAGNVLGENKRLATTTLSYYALQDANVNNVIQAEIAKETDKTRKEVLQRLLMSQKPLSEQETKIK